jgi:MoaA/NifB/PqqE/SkfB family radical SAM enzyme
MQSSANANNIFSIVGTEFMNVTVFPKILYDVCMAHACRRYVPVACHFAVTYRCPWQCRYCGFRLKNKDECSTGQALEIIRSLAKLGNKRLHFTGGEPLLRSDIGELVAEAKNLGLFVTMATSGYALTDLWEKIKDIDIFFFSFDGPREIHDGQRSPGAFDTLMKAMDFLEHKKRKFWTTTVLTSQNLGHIDYILDMARSRDFTTNFQVLCSIAPNMLLPGTVLRNHIEERLRVDHDKYANAIAFLQKRKKTDAKRIVGASDMFLDMVRQWENGPDIFSEKPSKHCRCWAGKLYCFIDPSGDLYPCGDIIGTVAGTSAVRLGFEKAFRSLPRPRCQSCIVACYSELNLMFSLNVRSILNWVSRV